MNLKLTRLHLTDTSSDFPKTFKTGVSLHCHTQHSKEMLDFVPGVAAQLPIIKHFWERERKGYLARHDGKPMPFDESYWTPPLSAQKVYDLERQQINTLGLDALVSLTDHDEICANELIRATDETAKDAPISLEWTVPFEGGFFHVGVHNLPFERAADITKDLLDFTFAEKRELKFEENRLDELFGLLNEIPQVLIVLNHPLWDIELFGRERHAVLLDSFLARHGKWIHAFEINGFRKWSENKRVLEMGDALGFPVVSGGDRHGCQPNSVVNLATSRTFDEFVEQIRQDKHSQVVLMPHYYHSLNWRQLESFAEILKNYPEYDGGRHHWQGRVYAKTEKDGLQTLAYHFPTGGPVWLKAATWTLGAMGSSVMRPVFKLFVPRRDRAPRRFDAAEFERFEEIESSFPTRERLGTN